MAATQRYRSDRRCGHIICVCLMLLALPACTDKGKLSKSESTGIELPRFLQRMTVPSNGTLEATLTIDQGTSAVETHKMNVDIDKKQLSISRNIDLGIHSFLIQLYYSSPSINGLRLVSASQTVNVTGNNKINFNEGHYIYDDNDEDNFTNVVEIENNSNPLSFSSIPSESIADDNYEPNNTYNTAYDLSPHRGTYFDQTVATNTYNGKMSSSDKKDYFKITTTDSMESIEIKIAVNYGIRWQIHHIVDNQVVAADFNFSVDEKYDTHIYQEAIVKTTQPGDYFIYLYSEDDSVDGRYSFGWF